jgi:hypothetical protein
MKFLIKITILCLLSSFALNEIFKTISEVEFILGYIDNKIIYELPWDPNTQTQLNIFDTVDNKYHLISGDEVNENVYFAMTKENDLVDLETSKVGYGLAIKKNEGSQLYVVGGEVHARLLKFFKFHKIMQYLLCFKMYEENGLYFYRLLGQYEPRPEENREGVDNENLLIQPTSLSQKSEVIGENGDTSKVELGPHKNKHVLTQRSDNLLHRLHSIPKSFVPRGVLKYKDNKNNENKNKERKGKERKGEQK